jgi:ribosomal protein S17
MTKPFEDPIVREVHETRARLLAKYGGAEGYAEHIRQMEVELGDRVVTREPRPPVKTHRKVS